MKAGMLDGSGVSIHDVAEPCLAGGDLLVRMNACGLCGSDVEKAKGRYRATGRIGHEPAGTVSAVAEGVDGFSQGDRVFVHHHVPCYSCDVCRGGAYTFCPAYQKTNIEPCGFAERFRVPRENVSRGAVLHLPESMTFEEATFIEPLGCCIDALRALPFSTGDRVLVLGLGPIGILYLRLLRASGARRLSGGDLSSFRRDVAMRSGAEEAFDPRHDGGVLGDFDIVVVATSAEKAIADGMRWVRRGGTLNLFGLPPAGSHLETDLQELYMRGIRLIPTYATSERGTNRALELLSSGMVKVADLITHRFPLDNLPLAFQQASATEETMKIVVTS